ncbi:RHS repeat-associated core domain-containing protein [Pseudescherichia sp.]|uniref:RHS repeat-associated core domain-containing protein n=1 Tax=Pseudescherichia sp. TaxID=2055881 RepID=UPI0028A0E240|nr:RHS repeat-associated core domain-containing protein [Pseudescherichia sp.]
MANTTAATGTPVVSVHDNRGLIVRVLNWNREQTSDPLRLLITHSQTNDASRVMSHRDPRLFAAWKGDSTAPANLRATPSLAGQVLRRESSDSGEQVKLFDAAGRAVWSRDGRGTVQTVAYDEPGRPSSGSEQLSGSEIRVSWRSEYGDSGPADDGSQGNNLRGVCVAQYNSGGLVQVNAVALSGAMLSQTQRFLSSAEALPDWPEDEAGWEALLEAETYTTSVTADARGAVLKQTDAKDHVQAWRYNVSGNVCYQDVTPADGEKMTLLAGMAWSAAGQVLTESSGNGVTTTYGYDPQNQWLSTITAQRTDSTTLQALSYGYDFTGNVTSLTDGTVTSRYYRNQATAGTRLFTYDALYQLLSATGRENANHTGMQYSGLPVMSDDSQYVNYTRGYTYDDSGNLTTLKHTGAGSFTRTMTTENTSNRSVQQNDGGPQNPDEVAGWFDSNGNLLTLQARAPVTDDNGFDPMVWDGSNNLQRATVVSRSSSDNDREIYQYSGSQRVRKQTRTLANSSTGLWNVDEVRYLPGLELRKSWQETAGSSASPSLSEELHVITGQAGRAGIRVLHWETGKPEEIAANDQVRWSVDDNIGSLSLELDSEGQLISREEYYPFGGTAVWAARSEMEADYKTVRYSGKERDGTGLYYYGYRYYAPWLCRWVSADPAGEVDGLNLFRMVRNNPVTLKDDDGREPTDDDMELIHDYAARAGLRMVKTYQAMFTAVYETYGVDAYNDLWNIFNETMPLSSANDLTPEHMKQVYEFIKKREIIEKIVYTRTIDPNLSINVDHAKLQLYKIPLNVLEKLQELGQYITFTNDNITNNPLRAHLKGVIPRGHVATWDTVPGVGAQGKNAPAGTHGDETVIAMSQTSSGQWQMATNHGSTNLMLHEFAHAIDRSFGEKGNLGDKGTGEEGDYLSRRQSFRHAWRQDLSQSANDSDTTYYWQGGSDGGAEETFAEAFGDMYGGTNYRHWPNVKSYISEKMKTIN